MQNKSTIGYLNKQYKSVLKKCIFLSAALLLSSTANALNIYNDVTNIAELRDTITNNDYARLANDITVEGSITFAEVAHIYGNGFALNGGNKNSTISFSASGLLSNVLLKNFATTSAAEADVKGGAFVNLVTSNDANIIATFINNSVHSKSVGSYSAQGGGVYNEGTIAVLYSDFTNNSAKSDNGNALGGALYNEGGITLLSGTYKNNQADSGGAIANISVINTINAVFENNKAQEFGGAIANEYEIYSIQGIFKNNTAGTHGGAIYNTGELSIISDSGTTLFEGNKANNISNAIYNTGELYINAVMNTSNSGYVDIKDNITGDINNAMILINDPDFIKNSTGFVMMDGIFSGNSVGIVSGYLNFADGSIKQHVADGGFSVGRNAITYLDADFKNSQIDTINATSGEIKGTIGFRVLSDINTQSLSNYTIFADAISGIDRNTFADAYTNNYLYEFSHSSSEFTQTQTDKALDVAFQASKKRTFSLTSDLSLDYDVNAMNDGNLTIFGNGKYVIDGSNTYDLGDLQKGTLNLLDLIITNAADSASSYGGALTTERGSNLNVFNTTFKNNTSYVGNIFGGVLYLNGKTSIFNSTFANNTANATSTNAYGGAIYNDSDATTNIYNTSFTDNKASGADAKGGAIYNTGKLNIYAVNGNTEFSGNKAGDKANAIYAGGNSSNIKLMAHNGSIIFNDPISGSPDSGGITIGNQDHMGTIELNADMSEFYGNVKLDYGVLKVGSAIGKDENGFTNFFSGGFFSQSGAALDAQNSTIDKFDTTNWTGDTQAFIDVDLSGDGSIDFFEISSKATKIMISGFNIINPTDVISKELIVTNNGSKVKLDEAVQTIYTPIYAYDIDDTKLQSDGILSFTGSTKNQGFTPSILNTTSSRHAKATVLTNVVKKAINPQNRVELNNLGSGDEPSSIFTSAWVDFSGASEDVDLDGLKVDNDTYIALVGADIKGETTKGWNVLYSIYAGYIASEQKYSDVKTNQDGLVVGVGAKYSKDAIYSALTANIGMSFVDTTNSFGKEDFEMYNFSVASKTGVDFDIYSDKYTLSPSMTLGYHYIHTPDYRDASNNLISSDGLNIFTVTPEIKFSINYGDYKPFVAASYHWNIHSGGDVTAGDALLPNLTADSYAEYSIGLDATITQNISGYAQINATQGDVEGYGAQAGIKWEF